MLPIPPHFNPLKVSQVWRVPYGTIAPAAEDWASVHAIRPAAEDRVRVCLMIVDAQNTFCIPFFELFVGGPSGFGAIEDNVRLCEFIYRHLGRITQVVATLDTHHTIQIFHPVFLVDERGAHPPPMTAISLQDVEAGRWKVNPKVVATVGRDLDWLERHLAHYCRRLADTGKYTLMIWPYHAMLGGVGHALVSAVDEALFFHSIARRTETMFETKGDNLLTEHYSVLGPEVLDSADGSAIGQKNTALVERLLGFDAVIIAGQAKSHCVAWTVEDLLAGIAPSLAKKVYLLEDCTSPVVVPGVVDFTAQAHEAFKRFAAAGMHIVRSTDPIDSWPEFPHD